MALLDSMGAYGTARTLAYGRVRGTANRGSTRRTFCSRRRSPTSIVSATLLSDGTYQQICITAGLSASGLPSWNESPGGVTGWGAAAFKNQGSTNGAGTQYGLWVLGEGEWDGFDTLWNQTSPLFVIGAGYSISSGTYDSGPSLLNPAAIHFHSGTDGAFGASLPTPIIQRSRPGRRQLALRAAHGRGHRHSVLLAHGVLHAEVAAGIHHHRQLPDQPDRADAESDRRLARA